MTQVAEKHATLQHTVVTEQEWIAARKDVKIAEPPGKALNPKLAKRIPREE
jgi:hypothetical protein